MALHYKIVLDTNALLYIERFKIDSFDELKKTLKASFYVTENVMQELKEKMKSKKKLEIEGKIALKLMKKNKVRILKIKADNADKSLEIAAKKGFIIVSNDKYLGKKIKKLGGQVIYLSKKKMLKVNE